MGIKSCGTQRFCWDCDLSRDAINRCIDCLPEGNKPDDINPILKSVKCYIYDLLHIGTNISHKLFEKFVELCILHQKDQLLKDAVIELGNQSKDQKFHKKLLRSRLL